MTTTPDASGQTQIIRHQLYHDRWSTLGASTGLLELSDRPTPAMLKEFSLFEGLDDALLEELSPDVSISRWAPDAVLFEQGSYIDLAFYIVDGAVDVFLATDPGAAPIFDPNRTVALPGATASVAQRTLYELQIRAQTGVGEPTLLTTMDVDLPQGTALRLGAAEIFGEIGALSGWPQSATARTAEESRLLQLRLPALTKLKKRSPEFKKRADALYRERTLLFHLSRLPLFAACPEPVVGAVAERAELVSCRPGEGVAKQGDRADALFLVRSGFVKLAQQVAEGELVVAYLSKGMTLGDAEYLIDDVDTWQSTATSVEYSELVRVPYDVVEGLLRDHPELEETLWRSAVQRLKEAGYGRRNLGQSELLEFSLDRGLVQGNSILVIDLESCTRCDDCVRACADTHTGQPRFVREGERYGQFLVTRSCYHCRDPVCLVGCPTGAIHRAAVGDVVEIQDGICIGCTSCANKCPYQAITMVPSGGTWGPSAVPEFLRGKERQVASKCDLCYTSASGPACVRNCPQGCAFRVGSIDAFHNLIEDKG